MEALSAHAAQRSAGNSRDQKMPGARLSMPNIAARTQKRVATHAGMDCMAAVHGDYLARAPAGRLERARRSFGHGRPCAA